MHFWLQLTENVEIGAVRVLDQEALEVVTTDGGKEVRNLRASDEPRQWEISLPMVDVDQDTADYDSVLSMWATTNRGLDSFNFNCFVDDTVYPVRFASQLQVTAPAGHLRHIDTFTIREVLQSLPEPSVLPAITGTATVGNTLTCSDGTWSGSPTITKRWTRDGTDIAGETGDTYDLVIGDTGTMIGCDVTATVTEGSTFVSATAVGPIA